MGLKDLTVAEMEGRLREMSATTFDGVFVWRISDFAKKRQDAIAGRAPAMFSPGNRVIITDEKSPEVRNVGPTSRQTCVLGVRILSIAVYYNTVNKAVYCVF